MNTAKTIDQAACLPPDDLRGNWSAELPHADTWRDLGGTFDTWWEAGLALIEDQTDEVWDEGRSIERRSREHISVPDQTAIAVGRFRPPKPPEEVLWGEHVFDALCELDHDDYCIECAEGWLTNTPKPVRDDLESVIRKAVGEWLDRHNLRPTWFVVERYWTVTAGEIRAKAKEMDIKQ